MATLAHTQAQIKQEILNLIQNKEICEEVEVYIPEYDCKYNKVEFCVPLSTLQYKLFSIVDSVCNGEYE